MPIDFDGNNRRITTNGWNTSYPLISFMGWVRLDHAQNGGHILAKSSEINAFFDTVNERFEYERESDVGNTGHWSTDDGSVPQGVPCHFAVVHDAAVYASSVAKMFINGVEQTNVVTVPTDVATEENSEYLIGGLTPNAPLGGILGDFRLYSRIVSDEEIKAIYSARGGDGIIEGLEVRHMLDERLDGGAGTTPAPFDLSINKRQHVLPASVTGRADVFGLTQRKRAHSVLA
jgi:hypothetical protein